VLKPANEITFIRQIKVSIIIISLIRHSLNRQYRLIIFLCSFYSQNWWRI